MSILHQIISNFSRYFGLSQYLAFKPIAMLKHHGIVILVLYVIMLYQNVLFSADINQLIEDGYIIINTENEQEYEEILNNFIDNPLIWSEITESQIDPLPFNGFLKAALLQFHKQNKSATDWRSFQSKSGFSDQDIEVFRLFITFQQDKEHAGKIYNFNAITGEDDISISKNLVRMKMTLSSGWETGLIVERDEDEVHIFDHANFSVQSPWLFDRVKINIGSFRFKWGTGLFFNTNPMNMVSNSGSGNFYTVGTKFQGYFGSDENNHLFGSSLSYRTKYIDIFCFHSRNSIDCNIDNGVVTSIDNSGYHVSENDIENHNELKNTTTAFGSRLTIRNFQTGAMIFYSDFNYKLQDFNDQNNLSGVSLFNNYLYHNISVKGEIAFSSNRDYCMTQTIYYRDRQLQTGLNFRYIQPEFQSFSGSTIRHYSGDLKNEKGFYYFLGFRVNQSLKMTMFTDFYSRIIPVNEGEEIERGTYSGGYLKYNFFSKSYAELKISRKNDLDYIKNSYTLKLKNSISSGMDFINRFYYTELKDTKSNSQGISSYISAKIKNQVVCIGATNYFSSSSDCNLYIYEPGIPLRYNMVTLSGSGRNYFANYSCQINQQTEIFISAKHTSKSEQDKYFLQIQLLVAL